MVIPRAALRGKEVPVFMYLIFWPWFAGVVFLAMGFFSVRKEFSAAPGLDKIIALGRVFAAAPLATFGAEHFLNVKAFSPGVPRWIPFHPFWIVFVGVALFAGALSLTWNRYTKLSSTLLAVMLFLFALLLHIPNAVANPHDRFALAVAFREPAFAGGFLAFAGSQVPRSKILTVIGRLAMAIAFLFFAVMHILHPQNAPGVPLAKLTPAWMPWPHVLATVTALFLLAAAVAIVISRYARTATACLGLWMVYLTLIVYVPIFLQASGGLELIEGVNYIFDTLLFAGTILLLASALPEEPRTNRPTPVRNRSDEVLKSQ
jgi:uncharacterized membrane protein YphA (DoxX/SURF4 family)